VAPMDWATCPHIIFHQLDMCQHPTRQQSTNKQLPHHHRTICTALPRQTVRTVRTGTVSINFFLVWLGEQIVISSSYDVHLTK
jgi:hypothetical protein